MVRLRPIGKGDDAMTTLTRSWLVIGAACMAMGTISCSAEEESAGENTEVTGALDYLNGCPGGYPTTALQFDTFTSQSSTSGDWDHTGIISPRSFFTNDTGYYFAAECGLAANNHHYIVGISARTDVSPAHSAGPRHCTTSESRRAVTICHGRIPVESKLTIQRSVTLGSTGTPARSRRSAAFTRSSPAWPNSSLTRSMPFPAIRRRRDRHQPSHMQCSEIRPSESLLAKLQQPQLGFWLLQECLSLGPVHQGRQQEGSPRGDQRNPLLQLELRFPGAAALPGGGPS